MGVKWMADKFVSGSWTWHIFITVTVMTLVCTSCYYKCNLRELVADRKNVYECELWSNQKLKQRWLNTSRIATVKQTYHNRHVFCFYPTENRVFLTYNLHSWRTSFLDLQVGGGQVECGILLDLWSWISISKTITEALDRDLDSI